MIPPFQPRCLACQIHPASVEGATNPLDASDAVAGFPMTILFSGTPEAAISNREVWGHAEDDFVKRPVQDVYSVVPSKKNKGK